MAQKTDPSVIKRAELLYVIERRPRSEVMEMTGMASSTFNRYRKKHKWDERRSDTIVSIPEIVAHMKADVLRTYKLAESEERPLTTSERDGVTKTMKQMQSLDKNALFTTHAIHTLDLFSNWVKEYAPELMTDEFADALVMFSRKIGQAA
jgi:hypothetical protein